MQRGKLRVYLGAAPGVGKTFAMLDEGQRRAGRGTVQTEMDLPAVLARKPEVALVDELAHTNIPGTEHEKRWQDIED
ncbi:MAG: hypothetical protein ACXWW1_05630, partial [Aeromicrobium sp.]